MKEMCAECKFPSKFHTFDGPEIGLSSGPRPIFLRDFMEFIFSNLHSSLSLAMKLSALAFTSGLGQNKDPPLTSSLFIILTVSVDRLSTSSNSGELHREL